MKIINTSIFRVKNQFCPQAQYISFVLENNSERQLFLHKLVPT